jgi:hypothetical protein
MHDTKLLTIHSSLTHTFPEQGLHGPKPTFFGLPILTKGIRQLLGDSRYRTDFIQKFLLIEIFRSG